jgi:hypothetical protein
MRLRYILSILLLSNMACEKLVEVNGPGNSINSANVFDNDATAAAILTGIYTKMSAASLVNEAVPTSASLLTGLSSDELTLFNAANNNVYIAYYRNALTNSNTGTDFWLSNYQLLYTVNTAIIGINNATGLTPAVKKQLSGEAKFIRAYFYLYLVNLYGDVPLSLTDNYKINATLPRTPAAKVWEQIIADLKDAQAALSEDYLDATLYNKTADRLRPTKWAATALLARALLYNKNWTDAETTASTVINQTALYQLESLSGTFLASSHEAIWQLQPVNYGINTQDAVLFILPSTGPNLNTFPVYLSASLMNSFEAGDERRTNWTDSVDADGILYHYAYKYKVNALAAPLSEYTMVFRLAEQYLIRAEARAQLGHVADAAADLNVIRNRAGLPNTTATSSETLLTAILRERQVELFVETGHRWFDLKRTGKIDEVMPAVTLLKGGVWKTTAQLYPIPLSELQANSNLVQNEGY